MMPYPNPVVAERELGFDQRVIESYFAQLYLRKKLNQIHGTIYNPDKPQLQLPSDDMIDSIQKSLHIPSFVPPVFKFDPADPPAGDILAARLRAKYWGAQVITYRPFVRKILELNFSKHSPSDSHSARGPDTGPDDDIPPDHLYYAEKGIQALIESTRAFHGLPEKRFIITNVFGTSHA